ncbi:Protein kinase-like domain [Pseudocohnilembus persalinus]|uniref:non-specific serine/threonine protein kinase n=1 Tax=Pseudocohnilembus persalinus TaxID=266149 RepID=A0A0V0QJX7_PSEPJ|nr:Protein kinase-like domain [Pseudocohnilembus persalinus]|eukprot:KRX02529.1 Protein kinase-like domain [Pseudocohnilembus persalinus]
MGNTDSYSAFKQDEPQSDIFNHKFINILNHFELKEGKAKSPEFLEHIEEYKAHCEHWEKRITQVSHPNVIQVHALFKSTCSSSLQNEGFKTGLLVDHLAGNLQNEMLTRQSYIEEEIWNIIDSVTSGQAFLQSIGFRHNYMKFSSVYIVKSANNFKLYKVSDEQLMEYPGLYREYKRTNKGSQCFMSPILLKGLQANEFSVHHNSFKSDVFSFGMMILQLTLWTPSDQCYDWQNKKINEQVLFQKINMVREKYSIELWKFLQDMLQLEEQFRPDWLILDQKLNQVPQLMGKRIAQTFGRAIDLSQILPQVIQQSGQGQQGNIQQQQQQGGNMSFRSQSQQQLNNQAPIIDLMNNSQKFVNQQGGQQVQAQQQLQPDLQNQFNNSAQKQFSPQNNNNNLQNQFTPNQQQGQQFSNQNQTGFGTNNNSVLFPSPYQQSNQQSFLNNQANLQQTGHFNNEQQQQNFMQNQQQFDNNQQNNFSGQNQQANMWDNQNQGFNNNFQNQNNTNNQFGNFNGNQNMNNLNFNNNFQTPLNNNNNFYSNNNNNPYNNNNQNYMQGGGINQTANFNQNQNQNYNMGQNINPVNQITEMMAPLMQLMAMTLGMPLLSKQQEEIYKHIKQFNQLRSQNGKDRARIVYDNQCIYEGEIDQKLRDGWGKLKFQDGSVVEGEWDHDRINGYARLFYKDGTVAYEGQWVDDQLDGLGKLYNKKESMKQIKGLFDYKDLDKVGDYFWKRFEGSFSQDQKEGFGELYLTNGDIFAGTFVSNKAHGYGTYYRVSTNEEITGVWINNLFEEQKKQVSDDQKNLLESKKQQDQLQQVVKM